MKNLIQIICLLLIIVSCQQTVEVDNSTIISGTISNASDDKILIRGADLDTTITYTGDTFSFKFNAENAAYYTIRTSKEYASIYLNVGDNLNFTVDAANFDSTLNFNGDSKILNEYLINSALLNGSLPNRKNLVSLDEYAFLAKLDSITNVKKNLLEQSKASFADASFLKYELARIKYDKLINQYRYQSGHRYYNSKPDFEVSENYYNDKVDYDLNDSSLLAISSYSKFVQTYLSDKIEERMNADTVKYVPNDDGAYVRASLDQLEESISNKMIQSALMYDFLGLYMTYIDHIEFAGYLEKFNNINTNQKKEGKLNKQFEDWKKLAKGTQAPNFKYVSFDGDSLTMDDFKGKYVYIDVWATWCGPCMRELPSLEKLQEEFKDKNITFMSVSIDNSPEPWRKMVENKEMKGVQLYAEGAWSSTLVKDYMIGGIPRFILVDTDGTLISASTERPSGGIKEILEGLERI